MMKNINYLLLAIISLFLLFIACPITVTPTPEDPRINSLTLSGPTNVEIAQTVQLTTSIDAEEGASSNVSYISSDTRIATVNSNGMVTGVSNGGVTITVSADSNTNVTASHSLTVLPPSVSSLSLTGPTEIEFGQPTQLTTTIVTVSGASSAIHYTSSDTNRVTVDSNGVVTGLIRTDADVTITMISVFDNTKMATHNISAVTTALIKSLSYGTNNFVFALGLPITPLVPTINLVDILGTSNVSFGLSEPPPGKLGKGPPAGLTFHRRTGEFSGTPSNVVTSEGYKITVIGIGNYGGGAEAIITISVTNTNN